MDIQTQENFLKRIIEEANKNQTKELQVNINDVKSEINEIRKIIHQEIEKRKEIEEKYIELKNKYDILEKKTRKNNIVIFGLHYNPSESVKNTEAKQHLLDFTIKKIDHLLGVQINPSEVDDIINFGKKETNKPILVKFCSFMKKQEILRNCKKLKGTEAFISEERNAEEREIHKNLYKYLKEARQGNKLAYIKENKLYINKKPYSLEELNQLQQENEDRDNENKVHEDLETIDEDTDEEDNIEGAKEKQAKDSVETERNIVSTKDSVETDQNNGSKQSLAPVTQKKARGSSRVFAKNLKANK